VTRQTLEAAWSDRVRAVVPVHLFGQMAPMAEINALASERGVIVLEDCAQAIGASQEIVSGSAPVRAGASGDFGAFSFFPTKNLGGFGDGGLVSAQDPDLAGKVAKLRLHGGRQMYQHEMVGTNSRLDALQAAVLRVKLPHLDGWARARRENACLYHGGLAEVDEVTLPQVMPGNFHVYNQFTVRAERRDELREHLSGGGNRLRRLLPRSPPSAGVLRGAGGSGRHASRDRAGLPRGALPPHLPGTGRRSPAPGHRIRPLLLRVWSVNGLRRAGTLATIDGCRIHEEKGRGMRRRDTRAREGRRRSRGEFSENASAAGFGFAVAFFLLAIVTGCASAPPFIGLEADPLYERAVGHFDEAEWDEAIGAFDHFLFAYPGEPRTADARMYLARAHFEQEQFITSAAEYERFLQFYPSHGRAPEASLGICRSYEQLSPTSQRDQGYTERAVDACRNTVNEFPGMTVAEEAREIQREMIERLAQREYEDGFFYERRGAYDSAILVYQDLVDFFPQTSWAPKGFLGLYRSYRAINWDTEAEQVRSRLLANYPDSPEAEQVREADSSESSSANPGAFSGGGDPRGSDPPA
jgi:outer membrane assembly lipoprotein YfiO